MSKNQRLGNCAIGHHDLGDPPPCETCDKYSKCKQYRLACKAYMEHTSTGHVVNNINDREPTHHMFKILFPGMYD